MLRKIALIEPERLKMLTEEQEIPLQDGMVKVRVKACGICGSDLALLNGSRDIRNERYFGHEFSGVVEEISDNRCGFAPGMRVASELSKTCGQCWHCRNGMPEYCRSMNEALLPGGFTEKTLVRSMADYSFLSPLPNTLDDITASLMEPTNCAYQIAKRAKLKPGDNVVVYGLGAMGFIASIILKKFGANAIIGVDRSLARLDQARKTGILTVAVDNDEKGKNIIREICGEQGPDIAIEATGASIVLADAIKAVRPGGRVVVGSVYHKPIAEFNPLPIFRKELTIVGAKGPTLHQKSDGTSATVTLM